MARSSRSSPASSRTSPPRRDLSRRGRAQCSAPVLPLRKPPASPEPGRAASGVSSSAPSVWDKALPHRRRSGGPAGSAAGGEMEAAPEVVHLALERGRLVQSARGPPTPRPATLQCQSSSQGLTSSAASVLHPPSGSWVQTAEGPSVELVPGGGGMLRVTAQLQRADGSWRAAAAEYDDGDEMNNRDGHFAHSIYHIGGEACCGLGDRGRERRGMPTGERAACADCALRILRRSPDRPPGGVVLAEAGTQCGAAPPGPPPALVPAAVPGPDPAHAARQTGTQGVVLCEAAARAVLEEWAADWSLFHRMKQDELATIDTLAGVRELATRAIDLQERHDALCRQHREVQGDHRVLTKRYGRLEQRAAAVAAVAQSFRVARVLGRGSYGTVVQTVPDHGAAAEVIKVPHTADAAAHESRGARLVLRAFGRAPPPGLEALVPKGELRLGGRQCMVYPLCGGGNMHHLLQAGRLAASRVEQCARRLLAGLGALHAAGLVHGDVKLENILLTSSGQPALGDVGLLRTEKECARHSGGGWGTPAYLAPEADTGPNSRGADVWALGCALWEMAAGDLTWWSEVLEQGLPHSERAAWAMRRIERAPAPLRRLIGGMLRTDPARRLTAPEAAAALR
eukprot:TRINITY_DN3892_c0_g1_i4.p1 TRINITY_DN3892_c0_g1~~TRINITY_DN3892_c0_g1_i4.p1  ORF type:complete len:722 (+),score=187.61 TRINITY_DN3892_c0_g1_i4:291-2168(+)